MPFFSSFNYYRCFELFFFFLIFIFTLFYFTIPYWFCHTLTWIHHECTWVPNPEPLSHLPPYTISLDHPRAPAPSILYPTSNIDWRFVSYMIVHMFQCHSPKSSHPLPLPAVQKFVLYICISFAVSHRGLSLPSFYIPYICVNILYCCFSFCLTSLCIIGSSFIHLIRTDSNVFFLMAE